MKRVAVLFCFLALTLLVAPRASATIYTLTDENSVLSVNATDPSGAGAYAWTVNGRNFLYQQWFWFRIGSTGGEASLNTLGNLTATQSSPDALQLEYNDDNLGATGLEAEVKYTVTGAAPGIWTSDVSEIIKLINHNSSAITLHFFQYSDFDLRADRVDVVNIAADHRSVTQVPYGRLGPMLNETVLTPAPSRAEAGYWPNTLTSLNNATPTTLNNVLSAGPGDVTWAFEWDVTIAGHGGTFTISKDKNFQPVPEPATLGLLGGILVVLARKLRSYAV